MERSTIVGYLTRNWFKLAMAGLLLFILLKKDLSFQIRLKAPAGVEEAVPRERVPARQAPARAPREKLAEREAEQAPVAEAPPPAVDRFDFTTPRSSKGGRGNALTELNAVDEATRAAFLDRFTRVAVAERKKFGVPASLILGHALLLSRAGEHELARQANNFFALPCSADWRGARHTRAGGCHRAYENAWTSFRDHSLYLTTGSLAGLRERDADDYKGWARELERAGFYPDERLAKQVVQVIEAYRLYRLDR